VVGSGNLPNPLKAMVEMAEVLKLPMMRVCWWRN